MTHKPSSFQSDAKSTVQLIRANPFLAGRDQIDSLQPQTHRNMTGLKYGANFYSKRLAAFVALISELFPPILPMRSVPLQRGQTGPFQSFASTYL